MLSDWHHERRANQRGSGVRVAVVVTIEDVVLVLDILRAQTFHRRREIKDQPGFVLHNGDPCGCSGHKDCNDSL